MTRATTSTLCPLAHQGLVHHVAKRLFAHAVTRGVEPDDVISAGQLGLLHAIERFDASLGNKFSSYAALCIHGFIMKEIERAGRLEKAIATRGVWMLREAIGRDVAGPCIVDQLEAEAQRRRLVDAVRRLPPKVRRVVNRRFFLGQTHREIGAAMGVCKQRVQVVEVQGVAMLREWICDWEVAA